MKRYSPQVPDGWQLVRLGDLATMSQGGTPRKNRPEYWDGRIPFVTGADLTEFRIGRRNARSFLTNQGLYSGDTVVCEPGALLLATRTAVGLAGMAIETIGASQDITCLVANGRVDLEYLCRALVRLAPFLQRWSRGTTIQGITRGDVTSLPILLPPLAEQQAIAAVMDSMDEAIERTEAVIAGMERLRDALLHELLTRGVPGWHSEWKEAPGIGTIPACWDVVRLGDYLSDGPTNGIYKPESEYGEGEWLIRIGDFIPGALTRSDGFERIRVTEVESQRYAVCKGDILINRVNSLSHLGKSVLIPQLGEPALFESNMMRLRMCPDVDPEFIMTVLLSRSSKRYFASRAKKAVQQASINQQDVRLLPLPLPDRREQALIAEASTTLKKRITFDSSALLNLKTLKTLTADALLTGRIRMPNDMVLKDG